jgi:fluoroquinolone resistance protein
MPMPDLPSDQAAKTIPRLLAADSFENEVFRDLDLQRAALEGKEFTGCTFESCRLDESSWKGSKLEACLFRQSDLSRASFMQTGFRGVRFEGSRLMGIDWSPISAYPELSFQECNLRYASFERVNLRKTVFARCVLEDTNFLDCDLSAADFAGSNLSGSNLRGCTLTRTDFAGAPNAFIDPARNRAKATRVSVETAVALAQSLGLEVTGYGPKPTERK